MDREDILISINFALRHKLSPRMKWKDDLQSQCAAKAILDHLELCGYELVKRPPDAWHSAP